MEVIPTNFARDVSGKPSCKVKVAQFTAANPGQVPRQVEGRRQHDHSFAGSGRQDLSPIPIG